MATYKITYIINNSYAEKGTLQVSDVVDEYDAADKAIYKLGLEDYKQITNITFVCE